MAVIAPDPATVAQVHALLEQTETLRKHAPLGDVLHEIEWWGESVFPLPASGMT